MARKPKNEDVEAQVEETLHDENSLEDTGPRTATKVTGVTKDAKLSVLVESNPKRPGSASHERFEGYFGDGINTVQDALDAGLTMGDIKYDIAHEFINVEGAEVEEYEVKPRGPRAKKDEDLEDDSVAETEGLLEEDEEAGEAVFG